MHPLQPVSEVPYMTRLLGYACVHVERPERERRGRYFSLREKGNAFAEQSCVRRMHCLNKLCIQSTMDLFLLNQMRKSCPISPHVLSFSKLIFLDLSPRYFVFLLVLLLLSSYNSAVSGILNLRGPLI